MAFLWVAACAAPLNIQQINATWDNKPISAVTAQLGQPTLTIITPNNSAYYVYFLAKNTIMPGNTTPVFATFVSQRGAMAVSPVMTNNIPNAASRECEVWFGVNALQQITKVHIAGPACAGQPLIRAWQQGQTQPG